MKKLIILLLVCLFSITGGEKIFGSEKSAHAKVILGGAEMGDPQHSLLKGFVYNMVQYGKFNEKMKEKCAEMLVWLLKKHRSKQVHDLTKTTDDLSTLFRACVQDINAFFANPKLSDKEKQALIAKWFQDCKRLVVTYIEITVKSKATGQTQTKIEWSMVLAKVGVKDKKKK